MSPRKIKKQPTPKVNGHVMVVDDDEAVRAFLEMALDKEGYQNTMFSDGMDALTFYEENSADVDIIILDMIMPEMDGWVAFKAIMRINPDAKVLIASAYAIDSVINQCLSAGALELLRKPYDVKEFMEIIEKYIDKKKEQ